MSSLLVDEIAQYIRHVDSLHRLNRDGLGTVVMRHLYDLGVIRMDQTREVGRFVATNANMIPSELAEKLVAEFRLDQAPAR
jgi:hypothetical protein